MGAAGRAGRGGRLRAGPDHPDGTPEVAGAPAAGDSSQQFLRWEQRYGSVNHHNGTIPRDHWLEVWETDAILAFHERHPLEGYRRLSFNDARRDRGGGEPGHGRTPPGCIARGGANIPTGGGRRCGIGRGTSSPFVRAAGVRPPYDRTYQKLLRWYLVESARHEEQSHEATSAALAVLVAGAPTSHREALKARIRELIRADNGEVDRRPSRERSQLGTGNEPLSHERPIG